MYSVFTISNDGNILLDSQAIKLCFTLPKLTNEQLRYIILAHDYYSSPHRLKPLEERKLIAKRLVWGDVEFDPEEYVNMQEGVTEYKSLIYDQNRETRDVFLTKLDLLNGELISETNSKQIQAIVNSITTIENKLEGVELKIDKDEQAMILKGDKEMSLIEKFMQNRESYRRKMKHVVR